MGVMDDILGKLKIGKKDNFPELDVPDQTVAGPTDEKPLGINEESGFKALPIKPAIDSPGAPSDLPPMPEETGSMTPALEARGISTAPDNTSSKADLEIVKAKLEAVNAKLDRIADMLSTIKNEAESHKVRRY